MLCIVSDVGVHFASGSQLCVSYAHAGAMWGAGECWLWPFLLPGGRRQAAALLRAPSPDSSGFQKWSVPSPAREVARWQNETEPMCGSCNWRT